MSARKALQWLFFLLCLGRVVSADAQNTDAQRGVRLDSAAKSSAPEQSGRYYALVIGNNSYKEFTPLQTARNDATEIAKVLRDNYGFGTKLLLDATRDQILGALDDYRGSLQGGDNLLVYFAGHGWRDEQEEEAYWIPIDGQKDTTARWINAAEITGKARAMAARHVLIISDSCYSGTLTDRDAQPTIGDPRERDLVLEKALQGKSRHIMSSGGNEPVSDANAPGRSGNHSVFADALLQGLREIAANEFTGRDLFYQYVHDQVGGESKQEPEYNLIRDSGHNSGDFVFFRLAARAATVRGAEAETPVGKGKNAYRDQKYEEAFGLLESAAETGNSEAMYYVGYMYDQGRGVTQDHQRARQWYQKAADAGSTAAMDNLGSIIVVPVGDHLKYSGPKHETLSQVYLDDDPKVTNTPITRPPDAQSGDVVVFHVHVTKDGQVTDVQRGDDPHALFGEIQKEALKLAFTPPMAKSKAVGTDLDIKVAF